jgi:type II secretory ATPase GspE/PulE/Tfp pilus assembly ATPase PilB-like protein
VLVEAGFTPDEAAQVKPYRSVGCAQCLNSGYKGRTGLFEVMLMDDDIRRLFLHEAPADQIREAAIANGMRTLRRDGLEKVAAGLTSLSELGRVVSY